MADRTAEEMRRLVREGKAMRTGRDDPRPGRFPIANREDLLNAIRAVGRVRPNTEEARARVRRFIMRRARELGLGELIPPTWKADGTLER
jgi:hypothetical protein